MTDDSDTTKAEGRSTESVLRPQDVATTNDLNMDTTKTEALWLITTKSIAGELEFDTRVVKPGVLAPMF